MGRERRYYHFKTTNGEVITILENSFEKAESKAMKYGHIIEYLGWTESFTDTKGDAK